MANGGHGIEVYALDTFLADSAYVSGGWENAGFPLCAPIGCILRSQIPSGHGHMACEKTFLLAVRRTSLPIQMHSFGSKYKNRPASNNPASGDHCWFATKQSQDKMSTKQPALRQTQQMEPPFKRIEAIAPQHIGRIPHVREGECRAEWQTVCREIGNRESELENCSSRLLKHLKG